MVEILFVWYTFCQRPIDHLRPDPAQAMMWSDKGSLTMSLLENEDVITWSIFEWVRANVTLERCSGRYTCVHQSAWSVYSLWQKDGFCSTSAPIACMAIICQENESIRLPYAWCASCRCKVLCGQVQLTARSEHGIMLGKDVGSEHKAAHIYVVLTQWVTARIVSSGRLLLEVLEQHNMLCLSMSTHRLTQRKITP